MLIILIVIAIILVSADIVLTLIRMKQTNKEQVIEQFNDKSKGEIKKFTLSVEATEDMTRKQISDALLKQAIDIFKEHTYIEVHDNVYTCDFSLYCEEEKDE